MNPDDERRLVVLVKCGTFLTRRNEVARWGDCECRDLFIMPSQKFLIQSVIMGIHKDRNLVNL